MPMPTLDRRTAMKLQHKCRGHTRDDLDRARKQVCGTCVRHRGNACGTCKTATVVREVAIGKRDERLRVLGQFGTLAELARRSK